MGLSLVSRTVVVKFWVTPWVTVPTVFPLAKVTLIDFGGQVEKYPADELPPATDAVITVVPGWSAVILTWFVVVLVTMEAMPGVPTT